MAGNAGLTFNLYGEDVSASKAMEGVGKSADKAVKTIGGAFAGLALGSMLTDQINEAFGNDKAFAKFKAGLGQTEEVAKRSGEVAGRVYRDGIGESLEQVLGAVGDIGTSMIDLGATGPEELDKLTRGALSIAEVMGVDVVEVTRAAGQMMRNGLAPDAQTAFDIIAAGAQNGANRSGDLLDTFNEYGPHFAKLGIDGTTALGMIKAGLDNGIFTSDLAADAFKEFAIRSIDGSKSTGLAYQALGLDAHAMEQAIAAGGPTAQTATGQIMTALGTLTDPVARETIGVALFGTQWEDSGAQAILAMNPVTTTTVDIKNKTKDMGDTLADTATNRVDKMKRSFDGWVQSMIETKGWVGNVTAAAVAFGPQAVSFAGSVGMVVVALKALGVGSAAAIMTAAAPLIPLAAAILAIGVLVKTTMDNIDRLAGQAAALARGDFTSAASLRSPAATFGVGSWMSPVRSYNSPGVAAYNAPGYRGTGSRVVPLASGGIVDRPTLAMIGEGGEREYVIPESKMGGGGITVNITGLVVGTVDELAQRISEAVGTAQRRGTITSGAFA